MTTEKIYPDAPTFVESIRSIGYSFESAVADIIDNSISKRAKNIQVTFDSIEPRFLAITDDGCGMNLGELKEAMKYGSRSSLEQRASDDLGRFGLGLKMASLSQCRQLTVVSKKDGVMSGAEWNLDCIGDWTIIVYDKEEIDKLPSIESLQNNKTGTLVLWRNFDRLGTGTDDHSGIFDQKIVITKKHLSLVFHRYLEPDTVTKKIVISFNGCNLIAIDPFMTKNPATQQMEEDVISLDGQEIRVRPYVLPFSAKLTQSEKKLLDDTSDLKLNQGFYVYRNRRLIIWGTWFRLLRQEELKRLARIRIDIPNCLDSVWAIDIKKSSAALPEAIKERLKAIVSKAGDRSEDVYRYRGRKANDDKIEHVWSVFENRGEVKYRINRETALFKGVQDSLNDEGLSRLDALVTMIEDAFPFRDVYCRYAKSKNQEDPIKTDLSFDECYKAAESYLSILLKNGMATHQAIGAIQNIDFIKKHPDVLKRLEENYGTD